MRQYFHHLPSCVRFHGAPRGARVLIWFCFFCHRLITLRVVLVIITPPLLCLDLPLDWASWDAYCFALLNLSCFSLGLYKTARVGGWLDRQCSVLVDIKAVSAYSTSCDTQKRCYMIVLQTSNQVRLGVCGTPFFKQGPAVLLCIIALLAQLVWTSDPIEFV